MAVMAISSALPQLSETTPEAIERYAREKGTTAALEPASKLVVIGWSAKP